MTLTCPVCSTPDQACGHTELVLPPITARGIRSMASNEGTIYLPKQHVKKGRGKPGYKGKDIKVVEDPAKAARAAAGKPKAPATS